MKYKVCAVILFLLFVLIALSFEEDKKIDLDESKFTDAIGMTIKEGTLSSSGVTVIIHDNPNSKNQYSEDFYIEKKEDSSWIELEFLNNLIPWETRVYLVNEEGILELEQHWGINMYGKLPRGEYRLIKYVLILDENGTIQKKGLTRCEKYKFYVEFNID